MADDMRQVVRNEQTTVAGAPDQTVVNQTTTPAVPAGTPVVPAAPVQTTVATTPPVGDRVVARNVSEAVVDPAAERAAGVDWVSRLVWFLVGVLAVLLAIRFVLLVSGANENAGFAQMIYGVTAPFVAPFKGLFGSNLTYPGAAGTGVFEPEALVAILVYALIGFAIVKIAQLMLGTNRNRGTVVSDVNHRTRV
jgi:YggT family protein